MAFQAGGQWEGVIGNALYLFEYRVANLHMAPAGQSTDTDRTSTCPGRQPSQPALHRRRDPTQLYTETLNRDLNLYPFPPLYPCLHIYVHLYNCGTTTHLIFDRAVPSHSGEDPHHPTGGDYSSWAGGGVGLAPDRCVPSVV